MVIILIIIIGWLCNLATLYVLDMYFGEDCIFEPEMVKQLDFTTMVLIPMIIPFLATIAVIATQQFLKYTTNVTNVN